MTHNEFKLHAFNSLIKHIVCTRIQMVLIVTKVVFGVTIIPGEAHLTPNFQTHKFKKTHSWYVSLRRTILGDLKAGYRPHFQEWRPGGLLPCGSWSVTDSRALHFLIPQLRLPASLHSTPLVLISYKICSKGQISTREMECVLIIHVVSESLALSKWNAYIGEIIF